MASSAASTVAASTDEKRAFMFEAMEASGESQYPEERCDPLGKLEEPAMAGEPHHPMARQPSLLSLTLDEIQSTMCEPGKNFGSMNMDEFLSNIWTAEEGTAMATVGAGDAGANGLGTHNDQPGGGGPDVASNGTPPSSLYGQGSVSLPATLCRKTVDEVWSEIQQGQQQQPPQGHMQPRQYQNSGGAARQPTFGEMTLEDFLIKAGVVREGGYLCCSSPQRLDQFPLTVPPQPQQQQNQYGLPGSYQLLNDRPPYGQMMTTMGYDDHQNPGSTANGVYHNYHQQQRRVGNGYGGGGGASYRGDGGVAPMGNGHVGAGSPVSPVSSDGFGGGSQVDNGSSNPSGQWVTGGGGSGGASGIGGSAGAGCRKRILDGPVDKVMERRQRRMIKNRESAARSRARKQVRTHLPDLARGGSRRPRTRTVTRTPFRLLSDVAEPPRHLLCPHRLHRRPARGVFPDQVFRQIPGTSYFLCAPPDSVEAYTVELETELNLLKEENVRLHEEQRRLTARRRQILMESMAERTQTNLQRNAKTLRHCSSCVW